MVLQGWRDGGDGGEVMRMDLLSIGGLGCIYHVVLLNGALLSLRVSRYYSI